MKKRIIKLDDAPKGPRIEVLGDGQQCIIVGRHESGSPYKWAGGLPSILPIFTRAQIDALYNTLEAKFGIKKPEAATTSSAPSAHTHLTSISDSDWTALIQALRFLLDKVADNDSWSKIGYAILSLKGSDKPAHQLWLDWSRKAAGHTEGAPEAWWAAHECETARSDYRSIFKQARDAGWKPTVDVGQFPVTSAAEPERCDATDRARGERANETGDAAETIGSGDSIDVVGTRESGAPSIRVTVEGYADNLRQMNEVAYPDTFMQGNALTRLGRLNDDPKVRRSSDQINLIPVTYGWAHPYLSTRARFENFDGRAKDWVHVKAPKELVNVWLGQKDWPELRPLDAIARAPFVRPDGSICEDPGYDVSSRALCLPSVVYPRVNQGATREDALLAAARLLAPFDEFPYASAKFRSAFLSHILTEVTRLALDVCPMYWYTAPDAGTGKSMLADMPSAIVHGVLPPRRPWNGEGDELRKVLFASLLNGDRSITFDNVPSGSKVRAAELCAFITSSTWQDRRLGESTTISLPNRSVVVASGNNITPVADMARRSVVVRLAANSETMKQRVFKVPYLVPHIMKMRSQLLIDALTIIQAFNNAGAPHGDFPMLASFEKWSHFCREPLLWLGFEDPCATQTETDDETQSASGVFTRLCTAFADRTFSAMDVAKLAGSISDADGELAAMMKEAGCAEPNSHKHVGYWLRLMRDKVSGGVKLVSAARDRVGAKWRLEIGSGDLI